MDIQTYKKTLELAIKNEIEAAEFYQGVAEKTKDSNVKSIFSELAGEERKHRTQLENFLKSGEKILKINPVEDYKFSETLESPKLSLQMKPADAIALAMKKEEEAMNMYKKFAGSCVDKEQKEIFESLSRMEQTHKTRLEGIYTDIAFPEAW
ncbi:MAG: ferritin family protein [Candidatus Riflebacteria bacterium]|nr:ferritin family protein [Candidatus Riflebacteria bacterium]